MEEQDFLKRWCWFCISECVRSPCIPAEFRLKGTLTWLSILQLLAVFSFDGGRGRHPLDLRVSVLLVHHWNDDIGGLNAARVGARASPNDTKIKALHSLPTFLSLFDDLPQGFLQAVGPQHQLLLGPVGFAFWPRLAAAFAGARAAALLAGHRTCWHHLDAAGKLNPLLLL